MTAKITSMVAAVLFFGATAYSQPNTIKATVWDLFGPVTYSAPGKSPQRVQPGTILPPGSVLKTGVGAAVDLHVGKLLVLRLPQNSILYFEALSEGGRNKGPEVQLTLSRGTLLAKVNSKLPPQSRVEVKLSNGVASFREGVGRLNAAGYLVQLEGTMLFAYVPSSGEAALHTLHAPPPVYFSPTTGVRPAPAELIREVRNQIQSGLH